MKLSARLRRIGKISRAVLFPIGDVSTHLGSLTRRTAQESGIQPQLVQRLEALAQETCRESGLTPTTDWDNHRPIESGSRRPGGEKL
jgi:hypothetical protein